MKALRLTNDLYWTGVLDPDLRVFDIIMHAEFGTTYNAYCLHGAEKTALFETVKARFADEYFADLAAIVAPEAVDYLIVNHTEPDHAGSVERLLDINPNLTIVGTTAAIGFLKQIVNRDFTSRAVKDGETLSLGGKTLRFFFVPNLHWPDTMFTYIEEEKTLVTCDAFGAHYSHQGILRSTVADESGYLRAVKYYFDNILGPFKRPFLQNALDKIAPLQIDRICTGHGPVLDSHIDEIMALYRAWCAPAEKENKQVVIPYVSAYGYTRAMAEAVAAGVTDAGVTVRLYDMTTADHAAVLAGIQNADGVLFGTPTILGDTLAPIAELTLHMFAATHGGKRAGAFGSYGWSGEGVPHLLERLRQLKFDVRDDGFRVRFKPTEADLAAARAYGASFAKSLGAL